SSSARSCARWARRWSASFMSSDPLSCMNRRMPPHAARARKRPFALLHRFPGRAFTLPLYVSGAGKRRNWRRRHIMFGFFAGALGAYAVYRLVQHRRYGWGHRWGGGGFGYGGGFGPRMFTRRIFERLNTTPGQERVPLEVMESLQTAAQSFR